jgi:hypothetical protein
MWMAYKYSVFNFANNKPWIKPAWSILEDGISTWTSKVLSIFWWMLYLSITFKILFLLYHIHLHVYVCICLFCKLKLWGNSALPTTLTINTHAHCSLICVFIFQHYIFASLNAIPVCIIRQTYMGASWKFGKTWKL